MTLRYHRQYNMIFEYMTLRYQTQYNMIFIPGGTILPNYLIVLVY